MTTLTSRGRTALLLAALAALAPGAGCSLFESCRDGCTSTKATAQPATVTIPQADGTTLPPAGGATQAGMTPATR